MNGCDGDFVWAGRGWDVCACEGGKTHHSSSTLPIADSVCGICRNRYYAPPERGANLSRSDADDCHHASGKPALRAVRPEVVLVAGCAVAHDVDVLQQQPCIEQLSPVRLDKVEMHGRVDVEMSGSARRHEQQWIAQLDGIFVVHVSKEFVGIRELRTELFDNIIAYCVTTLMNARADSCLNVLRIAPEPQAHRADTFVHDALHRSAPTCMKRGNNLILRIVSQYRNTVRHL